MKHTPFTVLILIALLLSSGTAMAQSPADPVNPPADVGIQAIPPFTVRVAVPIEDGLTDPIDPAYNWITLVSDQLFSGLTRIDPSTSAPVGDLASAWTHNLNSSVFTFTLRPGIKWSNGVAITATDVKNSLLRALDPATGSAYAYMLYNIQNASEFNNGIAPATSVGITVLSTTQIKFTLTGPAAYFPAVLATNPGRIVPVSVIKTWGSAWTEPAHIVTSGPYRLTEWLPGEKFQLEKNMSFYDAAKVKVLHVTAFQLDEYDAWSLFFAGGLDTVQVPSSEVGWVKADPTWGPLLHAQLGNCAQFYGFSVSQPPFDNVLVRKAFIAAIDRQGVLDNVQGIGGTPAQTFTPPGFFGAVDGPGTGIGIPYSTSDAQQYLLDAAYGTLPAIGLWYNTNPVYQAIAQYVQQNWIDTLSANVTVQELAWQDYLPYVDTGAAQIWRMGWCSDYNDAYNWLHDGVVNMAARYGGWSNATYLNLLSQAAAAADPVDRLDLYQQAEEILVETDAVMAPVYHYTTPILTRSYLNRPYAIETHIRDWSITPDTTILTSEADRDGWVLETAETTSVGGTINSGGASLFVGDDARNRQYRSVLSFDTSSLPNNAILTSVTLKVKSAGAVVGTSPFATHGNLLADVRFGALSRNVDLQSSDFQASPTVAGIFTVGKVPLNGWYSGAMPANSLGFINKTGMTQFRLRFALDDNNDLGADYLKLYSGNALDRLTLPQLIIKYYVP